MKTELKAKDNPMPQREIIEDGTYPARIYSIIHLGHVEGYQGAIQDKIRITYELPTELKVFKEEKGEQPRVISTGYTLSFNERANLRKVADACELEPTKDDEDGFDFINVWDLIGSPCLITVGHKKSEKSGNNYNIIENITKLMKDQKVPDQINPSYTFDVDNFETDKFNEMPEFLQEDIKESEEYKRMQSMVVDPETGEEVAF